jgi:hypothetical protein
MAMSDFQIFAAVLVVTLFLVAVLASFLSSHSSG